MRTSNIMAGPSNSSPAKSLSHRERIQIVTLNIRQFKMDIFFLYIYMEKKYVYSYIYI